MRYLTAKDLSERYALSQKTIYKMVQRDGFPKPKKFGRASRWHIQEIEHWEKRTNKSA